MVRYVIYNPIKLEKAKAMLSIVYIIRVKYYTLLTFVAKSILIFFYFDLSIIILLCLNCKKVIKTIILAVSKLHKKIGCLAKKHNSSCFIPNQL